MNDSYEIRPFQPSDSAELVALCREHAVFERASLPVIDDVNPQALALRISRLFAPNSSNQNPAGYCWVVATEHELAGFASATLELSTWMAGHFLHLDCLFLRNAYRNQGLGQALILCVTRKAIELDAINVQWQTPVWNEAGIRFYRRLGAEDAPRQRFVLDRASCIRFISQRQEPA